MPRARRVTTPSSAVSRARAEASPRPEEDGACGLRKDAVRRRGRPTPLLPRTEAENQARTGSQRPWRRASTLAAGTLRGPGRERRSVRTRFRGGAVRPGPCPLWSSPRNLETRRYRKVYGKARNRFWFSFFGFGCVPQGFQCLNTDGKCLQTRK